MNDLDQRIAAALRAPDFDRPLPPDLADRVAAAARAAQEPQAGRAVGASLPFYTSPDTPQGRDASTKRPPAPRHSSLVTRHSSLRRAAAVLLLALGFASAAATAWFGVLRPGVRWGVSGGDRSRPAEPGKTVSCLVFAVPCAPEASGDAIEERVLGPLARLAQRNGWTSTDAVPALGTLAHGAFAGRGGVLLIPLPDDANADAVRTAAREKAETLAQSFPDFAGPPLVDVRPFAVPSPNFASEAALSFADQVLLEAATRSSAAEEPHAEFAEGAASKPHAEFAEGAEK